MHSELRVWLALCQNVCLCLQVFTREELEMVAELCKKYDVICLMDEVYEWLIYSGTKHVRMGETSIMTSSLNPLILLLYFTQPRCQGCGREPSLLGVLARPSPQLAGRYVYYTRTHSKEETLQLYFKNRCCCTDGVGDRSRAPCEAHADNARQHWLLLPNPTTGTLDRKPTPLS